MVSLADASLSDPNPHQKYHIKWANHNMLGTNALNMLLTTRNIFKKCDCDSSVLLSVVLLSVFYSIVEAKIQKCVLCVCAIRGLDLVWEREQLIQMQGRCKGQRIQSGLSGLMVKVGSGSSAWGDAGFLSHYCCSLLLWPVLFSVICSLCNSSWPQFFLHPQKVLSANPSPMWGLLKGVVMHSHCLKMTWRC